MRIERVVEPGMVAEYQRWQLIKAHRELEPFEQHLEKLAKKSLEDYVNERPSHGNPAERFRAS